MLELNGSALACCCGVLLGAVAVLYFHDSAMRCDYLSCELILRLESLTRLEVAKLLQTALDCTVSEERAARKLKMAVICCLHIDFH